jgi:hypothetical protein
MPKLGPLEAAAQLRRNRAHANLKDQLRATKKKRDAAAKKATAKRKK